MTSSNPSLRCRAGKRRVAALTAIPEMHELVFHDPQPEQAAGCCRRSSPWWQYFERPRMPSSKTKTSLKDGVLERLTGGKTRRAKSRCAMAPCDIPEHGDGLAGVVPHAVPCPVAEETDSSTAANNAIALRAGPTPCSKRGRIARGTPRECPTECLKDSFALPAYDDVRVYAGTWQRMWLYGQTDVRAIGEVFTIIGRTVFFGRGRNGVLQQRSSDGAILIDGLALRLLPIGNECVLVSTDQSGQESMFRSVRSLTGRLLEEFQGDWAFVNDEGIAFGPRLRICGLCWGVEACSGILRMQHGHFMADLVKLTLACDGEGNAAIELSKDSDGEVIYALAVREK